VAKGDGPFIASLFFPVQQVEVTERERISISFTNIATPVYIHYAGNTTGVVCPRTEVRRLGPYGILAPTGPL
jgi:hypothetical protein